MMVLMVTLGEDSLHRHSSGLLDKALRVSSYTSEMVLKWQATLHDRKRFCKVFVQVF